MSCYNKPLSGHQDRDPRAKDCEARWRVRSLQTWQLRPPWERCRSTRPGETWQSGQLDCGQRVRCDTELPRVTSAGWRRGTLHPVLASLVRCPSARACSGRGWEREADPERISESDSTSAAFEGWQWRPQAGRQGCLRRSGRRQTGREAEAKHQDSPASTHTRERCPFVQELHCRRRCGDVEDRRQ